MPNQPKTPTHPVRIEEELWREFGEAAEEQGSDRSAVIRQFMEFYVRRKGAKLPRRPA